MGNLEDVKTGDKLFVKSGPYDKGCIVMVDRVTPTGRVITKSGEFNSNGSLRGDNGWQQTWARPATEDDIAGIYRYGLVQKLLQFRAWEKLGAEDLRAASEIIARYATPQ